MSETPTVDERLNAIEAALRWSGECPTCQTSRDDVAWLIAEFRKARQDTKRLAALERLAAEAECGITIYAHLMPETPFMIWDSADARGRGATLAEAIDSVVFDLAASTPHRESSEPDGAASSQAEGEG